VLALGERVLGVELALAIVDAFLAAGFEGGRHARRVEQIAKIEEEEATR
jgi:ribose 5-phosphate isomerase B